MSIKIIGMSPGSHEIVELTEQYDPESRIIAHSGKQHVGRLTKKYFIEDDINKLFEAIEIGSSRRAAGDPERRVKSNFSKSAMKRPMRVVPSQESGIGISESVSLKQALRGLCISHASEMAAVKKRMSRSSVSPGVSEAGVKKLYGAVVAESGEAGRPLTEGKGKLLEISLIPERSSSNFSAKSPESGHLSTADVSEKNTSNSATTVISLAQNANVAKNITPEEITPSPLGVGCELSRARLEQNRTPEPMYLSVDEKLPVLDETSPTIGEGPVTADGQLKEQVDEVESGSSIFNVERKISNSSNKGCSSSKPSLRSENFIKKKISQKTKAVKSGGQQNKGANSKHDHHTDKLVHQTPDYVLEKKSEKLEKVVSASSNSHVNLVMGSVSADSSASEHVLGPHICSKANSTVTKGDDISRSKEKGEISQSSKSSIGEYSSTTSHSDESHLSGPSSSGYRPHMSKDSRWEAISCVQKQHGSLGLRHFKLLRKLGGGDIGTVHLSELIGTSCLFAVKVMNNDLLAAKKKLLRAQIEREILEILNHPFLPTLYAHFTTNKFCCLVMEYCPGGDLHVLRQKQPTKSFSEPAARFYAAEVLVALEYLHLLGVVYRDLKPENILVKEDGHIMLSDFDLSLRCTASPTLLKSSSPVYDSSKKISSPFSYPSCVDPFCLQPSWNLPCFSPRFLSSAAKTRKLESELAPQIMPQLVVEPTSARSNSFVGTHEYLAPEIVKGKGHGSAVDWWTFGIFLYELLYGKTPFKGSSNEETILNVVSQGLKFPECPMVSSNARDLITRLLVKEPTNRLGSEKGAAEIKEHPFFEGLNWALIRCETPPELPKFFDLDNVIGVNSGADQSETSKEPTYYKFKGDNIEFEMF